MNDTTIKNFCMWARRELIAGVQAKAHYYGIREDGYEPAAVEVLHGEVVLTPEERKQREGLIQLYESKDKNYEAFIEQAAYTWFNRIMAIRFMELNDRLPSHTRMFSFNDGSFGSQAVKEALDIQIEGANQARVVEYKQASDDESLFRYLFLAQCNELSSCMPQVFDPVGSALELLLPDGLLRKGNVIERMVAEIPEEDWREGVEIVGWMYQYYNAERKDEVFASFKKGKKADKESIAPATQLFTPHWIVQYLTENSLGRLWMLNHPNSKLIDQMKYYLVPDEESYEVPQKVVSPEEITVCDPACGSGHILVYAFDLLAAMYEESGYSHRDIPRLVLENNLTGFEIDPRAAEMASFALTMKGCEWDRRFLRRNVQPVIVVLQSVAFEPEELDLIPELAGEKKLLDALAHLSECGSLFLPTDENVAVLRQSLERLQAGASLFSDKAEEKLSQAICLCEQLQRKFSVVVANPPYMGSSNMDKWLAKWTAKHYADTKRDLCTCFIERGFSLAVSEGYSSMVTMESWMFLGSFEKFRKRVLGEKAIATMTYMNHMVMRIAFNTCATVFLNHFEDMPAVYTKVEYKKLNENGAPERFPVADEDIYRRHAEDFKAIPGLPIAYWASDAVFEAFRHIKLNQYFYSAGRVKTHNNIKYLRNWWEFSFVEYGSRWLPYANGGGFSRWCELEDESIDCSKEAIEIYKSHGGWPNEECLGKLGLCWGLITSSLTSFRVKEIDQLFSSGSPTLLPNDGSEESIIRCLAFLNSSVAAFFLSMINPTLNTTVGDVLSLPSNCLDVQNTNVRDLVEGSIGLVKASLRVREPSRHFRKHPLL